MALTYWRDDCKTSHPQVDDEHQEILKLLKQLYQEVTHDEASDIIRSTLDGLFTMLMIHSENEETLMRQCSYPDLRSHIDDHEIILTKVFNLRLKVEHHGLKLTTDNIHDIANCINKHIWDYDLVMVQYLQAFSHLIHNLDDLQEWNQNTFESTKEP